MANNPSPEQMLSQVKSQCIAASISLFDAQEKAYMKIIEELGKENQKLKEELKRKKQPVKKTK